MSDTERPSIFDITLDEAEEARLDEEAIADYEAGNFVEHSRVVEWLKSWGTPNKLPCPRPERSKPGRVARGCLVGRRPRAFRSHSSLH